VFFGVKNMMNSLTEWRALMETEYLQDFIAKGGAAVKIAIAPHAGAVNAVLFSIAEVSTTQGFLTVWINAAETKVQYIQNLFYAVSREMPWDAAAERWLRERFSLSGYTIAEDMSLLELEAIATANNTTRHALMAEVRRWIAADISSDYTLCSEFRTVMALLCESHVAPQSVSPTDADVIRQWLRGESTNLTALKRLRIFQKVGRHNARALLESLAAFLPRVGWPGLVILIDMNAVASDQPASDNAFRYSRNAALDVYELLRQCIDETDHVRHFLLVAASGPDLILNPRKCLDNYTALKLRTSDEVRDKDRANPLGTLVRLDIPLDGQMGGQTDGQQESGE
jgi:hypothetical protein